MQLARAKNLNEWFDTKVSKNESKVLQARINSIQYKHRHFQVEVEETNYKDIIR